MTRYTSRKLDEYLACLDNYFEGRAMHQLGVPKIKKRDAPSIGSIANKTGIPASSISEQPELLQRIDSWIQRIGFGPVEERCDGPKHNRQ